MLVRNLRKRGDYERSILSQEELLRMAIANDRNVAQARAQATQGMIPELTTQQMRSKEEELTDILAIQAKAQENLLTLYPKETVAKFMDGLSQDSMTYLNVYWNDLKPVFKNKTGLSKTYFDRILKKHIDGIIDSRGMSTVPSSGIKNASLNEKVEVSRLGFDWMIGSKVILGVIGRLIGIANASGGMSKAAQDLSNLREFKKSLPTKAILDKADTLPEGKRGEWFNRLIRVFEGTDPNEANWNTLYVKDARDFVQDVDRHYPIITPDKKAELQQLYNFVGFE